jgi:thiol-disulfide isomerase/thioredoxin
VQHTHAELLARHVAARSNPLIGERVRRTIHFVEFAAAPEVRGTLLFKMAAAFGCAMAVLVVAGLPLRAAENGAGLQRLTDGQQRLFTLPDSDGAVVALEIRARPSRTGAFFCNWCEPCREELPALNRLSARANGSVKVFAISVAEVDLRVRRFIQTVPVDFSILLDRDRAVAKAWKVSTLPTTFVLDTDLSPGLWWKPSLLGITSIRPSWLTRSLAALANDLRNSQNHRESNNGKDDHALR